MLKRRRNKVVLLEWSRDGEDEKPNRPHGRTRSVAREAVGAAILLGVIILVLSMIPPDSGGGYRRDRLARYMCELVGTDPASPQCVAVAIGGWWVVVVAIGVVLKLGRGALNSVGGRQQDS